MKQYSFLLENREDNQKTKLNGVGKTTAAVAGLGAGFGLNTLALQPVMKRDDMISKYSTTLTQELPDHLANIKTKNGQTVSDYLTKKGITFSRKSVDPGSHFNPLTHNINLSVKDQYRKGWDKPLFAHELGHSMKLNNNPARMAAYSTSKTLTNTAIFAQFVNCFRSDDESRQKVGKAISAAGGISALPMIAEEIGASMRGTKMLNLHGKDKAKAFIGIGSYVSLALAPAVMYHVSEKTRKFLKQLKKIKNEDPNVNRNINNLKKQNTKVKLYKHLIQ